LKNNNNKPKVNTNPDSESNKPSTFKDINPNPNNNTQQQQQEQSQKNDEDIIVFEPKEKELLEKTAEELNIDLQNDSDLVASPSSMGEDFKPEDIDKVMNDKKTKHLIRDIGNNPNLFDTLTSTSDKKGNSINVGNLTIEDIKNIREEKSNRREELILQLANADSMKMHLIIGMKEGKNVWIEKEFFFNSYEQRQRFALSVLLARLDSLAKKFTLLNYKPMNELSDADRNFVMHGKMMIEVAGYRYQEHEFKLKFGMTPEDYARIPVDELDLAREVYEEHIKSVPSYKARLSSSSFKDGSGMSLGQATSW
jgi:hypothetical protein